MGFGLAEAGLGGRHVGEFRGACSSHLLKSVQLMNPEGFSEVVDILIDLT